MTQYIIAGVLGYLIGCIPMSYIVGRIFGKTDIRNSGSGNAGATNVLRTVGPLAGILALAGDFLKGVAAAFAGRYLLGDNGALLCGLMAVFGHCYPFTIGFKGGKGVATSAGMILVVNPLILAVLLIIEIFVVAATRYVSLASIIAAIVFPIVCYLSGMTWTFTFFAAMFSVLVVFKHKDNIKRLLKGEEKRISFKKE